MTNQIEPYSMIQKTNIKEHNDMVNKINEIVDVINNVNLDTINAEISGLKAKATATDTEIANIKNKDSMQDTEIDGIDKSLISNVTATFDNPTRELKISMGKKDSTSIDATVVIPSSSETGQYSAGNGITIQDYQIAVDTNVVALKTDIPVVPDVSGINNRLDTIDGEITGINANITNLTNKNTEQDTAINGKVAIAQGIENSGKVLGIGADGNVTPVNAGGSSGGGEVWEEIDLANFPTDWVIGDRIKITTQYYVETSGTVNVSANWTPIMEFYLGDAICYAPLYAVGDWINYAKMQAPSTLNRGASQPLIVIYSIAFGNNNSSIKNYALTIGTASQNPDKIKIWRLKKST